MVEEEVTTEIIKSEIQVDDDSSHFQIKNESVEYENGLDMKKVIVTKVDRSWERRVPISKLYFSVKLRAAIEPCQEEK